MSSEDELLRQHADLLAVGAYAAAATLLQGQPDVELRKPCVAFALCTSLVLAGAPPRQASDALAAAGQPTSSLEPQLAAQAAVLDLDRAEYYGEAMRNTRATVARVLHAARMQENVPVLNLASCEVISARLDLAAVFIGELDVITAGRARETLLRQAVVLAHGSLAFDAWAARKTAARGQPNNTERQNELVGVARGAKAAGQLGVAASAYIAAAEAALASGGEAETVTACLDAASECVPDLPGEQWEIAIRAIRARTVLPVDIAELQRCMVAHSSAKRSADAAALALAAASAALEAGEWAACSDFIDSCETWATEAERLGLFGPNITMSRMVLASRNANYAEAIRLGSQSLAAEVRIAGGQAGMLQALIANSCSFVPPLSVTAETASGRAAMLLAGAPAAALLLPQLCSNRQQQILDLGASIAAQRLAADCCDTLIDSLRQLAAAYLITAHDQQQHGAQQAVHQRHKATQALSEAEAALQAYGSELTKRKAAQHRGKIAWLQAALRETAQAGSGTALLTAAWRFFLDGGMVSEAADCCYLLGLTGLNHANTLTVVQDAAAASQTAAENLHQAAEFYERAGQRQHQAKALSALAQLMTNLASRLPPSTELCSQLRKDALCCIEEAEQLLDAVRRDFHFGSAADVQAAKQSLLQGTEIVFRLQSQLYLAAGHDGWGSAWDCFQRSKSRALTDMIGQQLKASGTDEGRPVQGADMAQLDADIGNGAPWAAVDWNAVGDVLWLSVRRPNEQPSLRRLQIGLNDAAASINNILGLRNDKYGVLRRSPEKLDTALGALVAPLSELTRPGEVLVLSPTTALHALPLHALTVEGQPLLLRNPCVYSPSLSLLRLCVNRSTQQRPHAAGIGILADPQRNLKAALNAAQDLGKDLRVTPVTHEQATIGAFWRIAEESATVLYMGHAAFADGDGSSDPHSPLASHLALYDGNLTAAEVLEHRATAIQMLILAGCQSGMQEVKFGDELRGLLPSFMYMGANTIMASLWNANQHAMAVVVRAFVQSLRAHSGTALFNKAQALQSAVKQLMNKLNAEGQSTSETIHLWAPFVLCGAWK